MKILICIVIIVDALLLMGGQKMRSAACAKACMANMIVIQGAVEKYNEKAAVPMTVLQPDALDKFFSGHLFPKCPSGGSYSLQSSDKITVICSLHGSLDNPSDYMEIQRARQDVSVSALMLGMVLCMTAAAEILYIKKSRSDLKKNSLEENIIDSAKVEERV